MIKNQKNNMTIVQCQGTNILKFVNNCSNEDVEIIDLKRLDTKTVEFLIDDKNLNKLKNIDSSNYQIKILKQGGIKQALNFFKYRIGLIIGLILAIAFVFFMNNRMLNIEIIGNDSVSSEEIQESLKDLGITKFSPMNFDNQNVENYLYQKFDFSLVSIMTKGNSMIINVKEELPEIKSNFEPIIAPYNLIIKSIKVYSGTLCKKAGDIVYSGDVIIEPYEIQNGQIVSILPCAEMECETFFSESYDFKYNEEVLIRSGKSKIIKNEMYLGNIKLFELNKDIDYDTYEIVEQDMYLSEYFLPLRIKKVIAYEQTQNIIENDFESQKDSIVESLREKVYKKVPLNMNIDNEEIKISSTNYGNIVTIYLKSSVYLKYNIT